MFECVLVCISTSACLLVRVSLINLRKDKDSEWVCVDFFVPAKMHLIDVDICAFTLPNLLTTFFPQQLLFK